MVKQLAGNLRFHDRSEHGRRRLQITSLAGHCLEILDLGRILFDAVGDRLPLSGGGPFFLSRLSCRFMLVDGPFRVCPLELLHSLFVGFGLIQKVLEDRFVRWLSGGGGGRGPPPPFSRPCRSGPAALPQYFLDLGGKLLFPRLSAFVLLWLLALFSRFRGRRSSARRRGRFFCGGRFRRFRRGVGEFPGLC